MPPKSTELRMEHFDENVYKGDSTTLLYKFMDALCGDAGAGSLKKEIFVARLGGALESIYFNDLDYIFGNMSFLSRAPSESYPYKPNSDMLTSDQWDEVRIKDAWYRARIKDFFVACGYGGTVDGIRMCVQAATSADCDVLESWRYEDDFGLGSYLGRSPSSARNEIIVRPHKLNMSQQELRILRGMLAKMMPIDAITTISTDGLSVSTPVTVRAITADSSYYEVQKVITGTPLLKDLPPPELLAIDLDPSQQWLFSTSPELAPYAAFNITQEYGYYYLVSGGSRSPVDSVTYGTLQSDGSVKPEKPFELYETTGGYTLYVEYAKADSPDNYPGGKFGLTPDTSPALNPDKSPYVFPETSQADYIAKVKAEVIAIGGQADNHRYRLPVQKETQNKKVYVPELACAYNPPAKDSTVTTSWTGRRTTVTKDFRLASTFVRN